MTYDASERSLAGGAPVELYTFVTGAITPAEGRTRDQGAQADAAARLVPVNEQLQQLAATLKDPALVESANALSDAIARYGIETERAAPWLGS